MSAEPSAPEPAGNPGTAGQPATFVFLSGAAQPLQAVGDQRFCAVAPDQAGTTVWARLLPEPHAAWYSASVRVDDDLTWQAGEPMISVQIEHDDNHRLALTHRQARALGALLLSLVLTACGGGGDDPDKPTPRVDCRVEVCR